MTDDKLKLSLSIAGLFLGGVTGAYTGLPDKTALTLAMGVSVFMGGLTGVVGYLTGYTQTNPRNQPNTSGQMLDAVKKSDMSLAAKAQVTPVLANTAAQPAPPERDAAVVMPPSATFLVSTLTVPEGLDPVLYADCLAVSRYGAAPTLDAFRQLPIEDQKVWRVYIAEAQRREKAPRREKGGRR